MKRSHEKMYKKSKQVKKVRQTLDALPVRLPVKECDEQKGQTLKLPEKRIISSLK